MSWNDKSKFGRRPRWFHFVMFVPMILVFIAAKSAVVMLLWNYLIPDLFHGPILNFAQTVGLVVLAKLLVGFGHRGGGFKGGPWGARRAMREKWKNMDPEQREKMRETIRKSWCD